jgi:hypothetical protein
MGEFVFLIILLAQALTKVNIYVEWAFFPKQAFFDSFVVEFFVYFLWSLLICIYVASAFLCKNSLNTPLTVVCKMCLLTLYA